jgi:hypothetical protein
MNKIRGDNMMNDEQYQDAVAYYEKALSESPNDSDITAKLALARSKAIADDLIDIRMVRNSGLFSDAATKLNLVLEKSIKWHIQMDSAIKYTMKEETDYASNWILSQLQDYYDVQDFNKFMLLTKKYSHIMNSSQNMNFVTSHKPNMMKLGLIKCNKLKSKLTADSVYYFNVVESYCSLFGGSSNYQLGNSNSLFSEPLIKNRLIINKHLGFSKDSLGVSIKNGIKAHPWFSQHSTVKLPIGVSGNIKYSLRIQKYGFNYTYKTKEEIFEMVKDGRKLIRSIPREKTTRISGNKHTELFSHSISVFSKTPFVKIENSSYAPTDIHESFSHNTTFRKEKIYPIKAKYFKKNPWIKSIKKDLTNNTLAQLNSSWIASFCENAIFVTIHENAARCALVSPLSPKAVMWSNDEFGLTYIELKELTGL